MRWSRWQQVVGLVWVGTGGSTFSLLHEAEVSLPTENEQAGGGGKRGSDSPLKGVDELASNTNPSLPGTWRLTRQFLNPFSFYYRAKVSVECSYRDDVTYKFFAVVPEGCHTSQSE